MTTTTKDPILAALSARWPRAGWHRRRGFAWPVYCVTGGDPRVAQRADGGWECESDWKIYAAETAIEAAEPAIRDAVRRARWILKAFAPECPTTIHLSPRPGRSCMECEHAGDDGGGAVECAALGIVLSATCGCPEWKVSEYELAAPVGEEEP